MSRRHASLGMSSADRWTTCTASVDATADIPNEGSEFSRSGTVCHQILEECLVSDHLAAEDYLGRVMVFYTTGGEGWAEDGLHGAPDAIEAEVEVTQDMVDAVEQVEHYVRERHALRGGRLLVEQRVPIAQFTGEWWISDEGDEESAHGYADVLLIGDTWAECIDAKFGFKPVYASRQIKPAGIDWVTSEFVPEVRMPNLQMSGYTLGAVHKHDLFGEVTDVTLTIAQPYIHNFDSYSCSIEELRKVEEFLRVKAEETRTNPQFVPTYEGCYYCRARGRCAAQTGMAMGAVFSGLDQCRGAVNPVDPKNLGTQLGIVDFVKKWAKDVEAAAEKALASGEVVVRADGLRFKLVEGRRGHRKWKDPVVAELEMTLAGVPEAVLYERSLISPTTAADLAKVKRAKKGETAPPPVLPADTWAELQLNIRQDDGKPQIVLETDPRPPINKADGFEEVGD